MVIYVCNISVCEVNKGYYWEFEVMFGYIESNCIVILGNMSFNIRKLNIKKF